MDGFSFTAAARITGLTTASLDRWARSGDIVPHFNNGAYQKRAYSRKQLTELKIAAELRRMGVNFKKTMQIISDLRRLEKRHRDYEYEASYGDGHVTIKVDLTDLEKAIDNSIKEC